jgi:phospholipid/cholesterol/gamma-HCH transport system permease protein
MFPRMPADPSAHAAHLQPDSQALRLAGDWTLAQANQLAAEIERLRPVDSALPFDASGMTRLDTAGAVLLLRLLKACGREGALDAVAGLRSADTALLQLLIERGAGPGAPIQRAHGFTALLARMGAALEGFWIDSRQLIGFIGLTLLTLSKVLTGKRRLRLTATVFHMEQSGLDAVPIVALLSFLVGAVVAFLGATVLRDFGASIFTVELVAYSFLREFGVLLTAILLAGRSGSAFTAQIGSMKSREELDAIRALGLDAIELLVLPRLLALLLMLPLLAFIGMISGLVGGALVGAAALDISTGMFISRLYEMTEIRHFWVGMTKAPIFAFVIAVVGCLEGMKVAGSAESVGRHTTSAVVQSIFLVIVLDALFAIFFMELGV